MYMCIQQVSGQPGLHGTALTDKQAPKSKPPNKTKQKTNQAGQTDQQLRTLAALPQDLDSAPTQQLTNICNSISRGSDGLFEPLQAPGHACGTQAHTQSEHPRPN